MWHFSKNAHLFFSGDQMIFCILALLVFSIMALFSAKYRPLAKEAFRCVFLRVTLRPCETGLDQRIKANLVAGVLTFSPAAARIINSHFEALSWLMVVLTVVSFAYSAYGVYNFYYFGNCEGPTPSGGACILNDITGDYGRFSEPKDLNPPIQLDGITAGNPNARVKIIEFGCFTCSYTKKAESTMQQLLTEFNGSIYYVFKPFPLPNHKYSSDIARAVLCANEQGKQLEFRAKIFDQQEICAAEGISAVKDIANQAGLDMKEFNDCLDNNETGQELANYIQQGKDAHIYATPTFFINGKPIVGPKPIEEFRRAIAEAR